MKVQVCIIGGGPSGLLLSQLLHLQGIDTIVLEKHSREYVLGAHPGRRAGARLRRADARGASAASAWTAKARSTRVSISPMTAAWIMSILLKYSGGNSVLVYGQTELTRDLYEARDRMGGKVVHNAEDVTPHDLNSDTPYVTYRDGDKVIRVDCDYVIGADGFHGVSRKSIPKDVLREYERVYPFGWLGVLSRTKPVSPELIYGKHERGFALCSLRSQVLSRYYIQVPLRIRPKTGPTTRSGPSSSAACRQKSPTGLITGPSIEKSIAPLRSFVAEPMRHGRLFLAGDAAHIVPPTGARGLNSAASDIYYLYHALIDHYKKGDDTGLDGYSDRALARVWKAQRFSWWMTTLLHRFPDNIPYDDKLQETDLAYLFSSEAALRSLAENYVGLPF